MKFVCEHCNAKYTIADEKLRNKVLKIRCKTCNNVIEVRDSSSPAIPAREPARMGPAAPAKDVARSVLEDRFASSFKAGSGATAKGTPGLFEAVKKSAEVIEKPEVDLVYWFVAIDNAPVGPMSARTMHRHRAAGRVTDASLVWKEGMPDWTPLRNCKDLIGLLARIDIEVVATKEAKAPPPAPKPRLGLFETPGAKHESPFKGHSVGVIAERTDAAEAVDVPDAPPASRRDVGSTVEEEWLGAEDMPSVRSIRPISPPRPFLGKGWARTGAVAFFAASLAAGAVLVFFHEVDVVTQVVTEEKIVYRDRVIEGGSGFADRPRKDGDGQASGADATRKGARSGKTKVPVPAAGDKAMDEKTRKLLEQLGGAAPVGDHDIVGGTSTRPGSSATGGSSSRSEEELSKVVSKNRSSLKLCYERSLKSGEAPTDRNLKMVFKFTVGPSGMARNVVLEGEGAKIPSLSTCCDRAIKQWAFPSSAGDSAVEFPFLFTPK
ncbi:MAG: AgmX/PglI C-terminal domain-containing protein [Deltaproteobacteria bacterium]|nr:AgmX/PglI C-terminal domain-containing protein [Deltaproteobacteria bacterium]